MKDINTKLVATNYLSQISQALNQINVEEIQKIANILLDAYNNDKTVFIMGNGGSASTASHMACDLGKGTLKNTYNSREKRLKVVSITDNTATITAYANDLSYEDIFSQQLHNLIKYQDVLIAISGYGNSPNIVKALKYARSKGAVTIGLLGNKGGKAKKFTDVNIIIKSSNYGVIEDLHLTLNHLLTTCFTFLKGHTDNKKNQ